MAKSVIAILVSGVTVGDEVLPDVQETVDRCWHVCEGERGETRGREEALLDSVDVDDEERVDVEVAKAGRRVKRARQQSGDVVVVDPEERNSAGGVEQRLHEILREKEGRARAVGGEVFVGVLVG